MKTKTLKYIRKYWEYRFCKGRLIMRRKADNEIRDYKSIQEFLSSFICDNVGIGSYSKWHRRKRAVLDKKRWQEALSCNS